MIDEKNKSENRYENFTKINIILISFAIVLTGSLSLFLIIRQFPSIWWDEAYSINCFTSDLKTMWKYIITDTHPPLYYMIMKVSSSIFGSEFRTIKAIQLIPVFATHLWVGLLAIRNKKIIGKSLTGVFTSLFILGTFAADPFMQQNVEIRMYSWAMFFVTISGVYALKMILSDFKYQKDNVLFIIFVLSAALTHYYALFCVIIICIFVLVFILKIKSNLRKKKTIIRLIIPGLTGYIWWLPFAFQQTKNTHMIAWISFDFSQIPLYLSTFIGFNIYFEILFFIVIIAEASHSVFRSGNNKDRELIITYAAGLLFFLLPFLLLLIGIILSLVFRPFILSRYIFPSLGLMFLGLMLIMSCIRNRKLIYCAIMSAMILLLLIQNYPAEFINENRTGTKTVVQYLEEQAPQVDFFVTDIGGLISYGPRFPGEKGVSVLQYYFPDIPVLHENEFLSQIDTFEGTACWFMPKGEKIDIGRFPGHDFTITEVFSGNIDNFYYFTLYKIKRASENIDQMK